MADQTEDKTPVLDGANRSRTLKQRLAFIELDEMMRNNPFGYVPDFVEAVMPGVAARYGYPVRKTAVTDWKQWAL